MRQKNLKKTILSLLVCLLVGAAVVAAPASAVTTNTTATTKAAEKPKTVAINIALMSETDAEVDIAIEKLGKKKGKPLERTVDLKKGGNYFTFNKGQKGNYRVTVVAFGDAASQTVAAVSGSYTLLFNVAPPKDGDAKKASPIVYKDLTKIKDKK